MFINFLASIKKISLANNAKGVAAPLAPPRAQTASQKS